MTLYIALALCAFLFALLVYRYDLYEREPWYMLALAIALGYVAMRAAGSLELVALRYVETHVAIAAVAALVEELSRFVMVVAIAVLFPRQFNDPMDGIVYGSMIGLGMAVEESFYLLGLLETPSPLLLPVEIVRLLGHLVMAGDSRLRGGSRAHRRLRVARQAVALRARRFRASLSLGLGCARFLRAGYERPTDICFDRHHVVRLFVLRISRGFRLEAAQKKYSPRTVRLNSGVAFYGPLQQR